jgi:hypothetical protein
LRSSVPGWHGCSENSTFQNFRSAASPLTHTPSHTRSCPRVGVPAARRLGISEASEVPLERIVVRPGSAAEEDEAELVLAKGSREEELLSLMDGLRRVSGVREVNSALMNGSAESKSEQ